MEEDNISENRHSITKKSLSAIGFRNNSDNQNIKPLAVLRATQSFTGAIEVLRLSDKFQRISICNRTNVISAPKVSAVCPRECLQPATTGPFRTREQNTLSIHVVPSDVLNYHGHCYEPRQIAMYWKKDCRMFLWKGKAKMKNKMLLKLKI